LSGIQQEVGNVLTHANENSSPTTAHAQEVGNVLTHANENSSPTTAHAQDIICLSVTNITEFHATYSLSFQIFMRQMFGKKGKIFKEINNYATITYIQHSA
jgi:hypothetical protein